MDTSGLMKDLQHKKSIAVLVSGGDCQVINTFLATFIKNRHLYNLFLVLNGYEGLYRDQIIYLGAGEQLNSSNGGLNACCSTDKLLNGTSDHTHPCDLTVSGVLGRFFPYSPGSIIRTSRFPLLRTRTEQCQKNLEKHRIDRLVVLGGDGSMKGAHLFGSAYTIPCSIDNDTYSMYSLGCLTAVQQVHEYIECVVPSNLAMGRNAVYEVMGNKKGFIAILSYFASYCDYLVLTEKNNTLFPREDERMNANSLQDKHDREVPKKCDKKIIFADCSADSLLSDMAQCRNVSVIVSEKNKKYNLSMLNHDNVRLMSIGFIQRGGVPTFTDRKLGVKCAYEILKSLNIQENGDIFINDKMGVELVERNNKDKKRERVVQNNIFDNSLTKTILKCSAGLSSGCISTKIIIIRDTCALAAKNIKEFIKFYKLKDTLTVLTIGKDDCLDLITQETACCNENVSNSRSLSFLYALPPGIRSNNLVVLGNQRDIFDLKNTNNVVVPIDRIRGIDNFVSKETILNSFLITIDNIIKRNARRNYFLRTEKWIIEELRTVYDYYIQHDCLPVQIFILKKNDLSFLHAHQNRCNIILSTKKVNHIGKTIIKISAPVITNESVVDKIYLRMSLLVAMEENGGVVVVKDNKVKFMKWKAINI